jgi:preprotein translocase subunit SecY
MINLIIFLIVFYLVYRILTKLVIPKYTLRSIKKYQEKFKEENPHIFKKEDKK